MQALRWWVLGLFAGVLTGQRSVAQTDSLRTTSVVSLSVVTVRAIAPERFIAGQKLQRIDSTTLLQFQFGSLTDLLTFNTPLAFKNYGSGQLATVSFRGTSANHTAVLWNGININQPNLGQTDFSTLPVAGFDLLSVQYGAGGCVVGSDAVGGSVLLSSAPDWKQKFSVTLGQQLASFQNYQTQLGIRYGTKLGENWQFSGRSFGYRHQLNNTYPYQERRGYFLEPSTTAQRGLVQDLFFRHKSGKQISVNAWLTDNDLIIAPQDPIARERTRTQSARFLTTYEANQLSIRMGWIRDLIDYAKEDFSGPSHTETDRLISRVEREFNLWPGHQSVNLNLRVGGEWSHYRTRTDGYGGRLITENRQDLYALLRLQTNRWLVSANVRQAFVTRFNPPLTPSLGVEYKLVQRSIWNVIAKSSIGYSYRVPTLNERYWLVLGNPDQRPERGMNIEGGLAATAAFSDQLKLTAEATAYHNRVDDWAYWNPTKNYHVENLQLVVARGLELTTTLTYTRNGWQAGLRAGYAYTRASQERVYDTYAQDVVGKQLVYVPMHTGTFNVYVQRTKTRLTVQTQTSSRRYVTFDNTQFFKGVTLANVLLEHLMKLGPVPVRVQGQANNVFDALAISAKRNALPGRNWAINLIINFPSNT
ncbi:TonB-dependent receptor plug domain-containing protein [Spirosoma sp. BT702]|uniref:TonB-dependent receptor plug domain-containing protein n=1 Tax=Spirosoma profusum TaxID=2771354 RepID=A0A926XTI2_9BACT|nr:TonB-dependent receptor plug domain-containing protein [Spirosoma profusum]MBD2700028.1 TonB-dependent receptor plug domain-containing protein [Spirosoma profusum]